MRPSHSLSALTILYAVVFAGCRGPGAPTSPADAPRPPIVPNSPAPPSPPAVTITSLAIQGPDSVAPGQTLQLTAVARFSDGSSRDVTSETAWESHNSGLMSISPAGVITAADSRGEGDIIATYSGSPPIRAGANVAIRRQLVLPAGTYRLYGSIRDEGVYLDDVRVELTSGPAAGMSLTANGFFYFYGVSGETEIRVSKDGYETQARRVLVTSHETVEFHLVTSRPRPILDGRYTLRLSAADECRANLPEALRDRTYPVIATQDGARFSVKLEIPSPKSPVPAYPTNTLDGSLEPNRLKAWLYGAFGASIDEIAAPTILEELATPETQAGAYSMFLSVVGLAIASPGNGEFTGTLDGSFLVVTLPGPWDYGSVRYEQRAVCESPRHRFVLTR
jgi:hypothetical protein